MTCIYCGSKDVDTEGAAEWVCNSCDKSFDGDDISTDVYVCEFCGLYEADKPQCNKCVREV